MDWSIGYDTKWDRDIGYSVPAYCDHPECDAKIDRGLAHVCAGEQPYGGENGCGLYFCALHLTWSERLGCFACEKCDEGKGSRFAVKADHPDWIHHKATDPSWADWRKANADALCEGCCKPLPCKEATGWLMFCAECFKAKLANGEIIGRSSGA